MRVEVKELKVTTYNTTSQSSTLGSTLVHIIRRQCGEAEVTIGIIGSIEILERLEISRGRLGRKRSLAEIRQS
jgi:hypothetical protein